MRLIRWANHCMEAGGEPGCVRQQLSDRDRPLCWFGFPWTDCDQHFRVGERGNIFRHWIVQVQFPLFIKHHHGDTGDRSSHASDPKDGVRGHRLLLVPIRHPDRLEVNHLTVAGHHGDAASDLAVVHETLHEGGQLRNLSGRDTNVLGLGGGQFLTQRRAVRDQSNQARGVEKPIESQCGGGHVVLLVGSSSPMGPTGGRVISIGPSPIRITGEGPCRVTC